MDEDRPESPQPQQPEGKQRKEENKAFSASPRTFVVPDEDDDRASARSSSSFVQVYASLMILLMTFFIVLVSLSRISLDKFDEVKGGLSDSFSVLGVADKRGQELFFDSMAVLQTKIKPDKLKKGEELEGGKKKKSTDSDLAAEAGSTEEEKKQGGKTAEEKKQKEKEQEEDEFKKEALEKDKFFKKGYSKLKIIVSNDMIFLGGLVEKKGKELYIRLPSKNLFYKGDVRVKPESLEPLKNIISLLKQEEFARITVRCFTDEEPIWEFSRFSYLGLSCLRGKKIADFFHKVGGIPHKKIRNVGFGDARHIKENDFNNSIELVIN